MSLLYKYISDLTLVLRVYDMNLEDNLVYEEYPIQILDRRFKYVRNKQIPLVKVF